MAVPVIIAGIAASFGAVFKLADNVIIAYFLALLVLMLDAGVSSVFGSSGAVGTALTFVVNQAGANVIITSGQLLVLVAFSPIIIFIVKRALNR